jgi:hypothetical protein
MSCLELIDTPWPFAREGGYDIFAPNLPLPLVLQLDSDILDLAIGVHICCGRSFESKSE